jgi:putative holliday junction resolvase
MRILALDYGERRVGVAVSDPTGVIAQPLETIESKSREGHLVRIRELVTEYEVARIVVGLPLHMDGRSGPAVEAARHFGAMVAHRTDRPVDYLDERWTTVEADRSLREAGVRGKHKRGKLDATAATLLLRTYLARGFA